MPGISNEVITDLMDRKKLSSKQRLLFNMIRKKEEKQLKRPFDREEAITLIDFVSRQDPKAMSAFEAKMKESTKTKRDRSNKIKAGIRSVK